MGRRLGTGVAALAASISMGLSGQVLAAPSIVSLDVGQPKAGIATTLKLRTIAEQASSYVDIRVRATGGPACAPTQSTDPGQFIWETDYLTVGDATTSKVYTFQSAGSYQWCAWLVRDGVKATSTGTFTVASPIGVISGVSGSTTGPRNRNFLVTVAGTTEVSRYLIWRLRRYGEGPCASSPSLDPGSGSFSYSDDEFIGSFSVPITLNVDKYGRYRLCSWVATGTSDIAALGVNETLISVPAPPRTTTRVGADPGVQRRSRPIRVSAFVTSKAGTPTGRCAFDRLFAGRWQPYTTVAFGKGQACRAKVFAGQLGRNRFRVRYLPGRSGFVASTGFSRVVFVIR